MIGVARRLRKLETLRGLAASYVLAGHIILYRLHFKGTAIGQLFRFGQEAVMLFFLLSGFVIFLSMETQADQSFRTYFVRRWRRIYPIFLLAIVLSFLAAEKPMVWDASSARELIGNVFMLQDQKYLKPGVFIGTFPGDTPLWSLSYEWWFYMMFYPIWKYVDPRKQIGFVAGLSGIGFFTFALCPNQISLFLTYFIIWWAGVEMARSFSAQIQPDFYNQRKGILAIGTFCLGWAVVCLVWHKDGRPMVFGTHPVLELRHFFAALVLMCGGIFWASRKWLFFNMTLGWFAYLAPISYALYLFHYPLCVENVSWPWVSRSDTAQLVFSVFLTVFLAYLAEVPLQRLVNRLVR